MAPEGAQSRDSTRSLSIKVSLIAVVAIAAVYFGFIRGRGEMDQPDTPESAQPYYCSQCKQGFELTPADYAKLSEEGGIRSSGEERRGGRLVLRCPKCGQFTGAAAIRCPKDGTILPRIAPDGTSPRCPKCNWSP